LPCLLCLLCLLCLQLLKAILNLEGASFPLTSAQQDSTLGVMGNISGVSWQYRSQQPSSQDSQPQMPSGACLPLPLPPAPDSRALRGGCIGSGKGCLHRIAQRAGLVLETKARGIVTLTCLPMRPPACLLAHPLTNQPHPTLLTTCP